MQTLYYEKNIPRIAYTKLAADFCRKLLYTDFNAVQMAKDIPDPELPAEDWVRVENRLTGICGSDVTFFLSKAEIDIAMEPLKGFQRTFLGHETVGIVTEVGSKVKDFKVGDRVTLKEYMPNCDSKGITPKCRFCSEGNYSLCENVSEPTRLQTEYTGAGFGDQYVAHQNQIMHVDNRLTDEQVILIEPASCGLHAVLRDRPQPGEKILVMGLGAIGLSVVQWLRILFPSCEVYGYDRLEDRQKMAVEFGAKECFSGDLYKGTERITGAKRYVGMMKHQMLLGGFDRIYDCIGNGWAIHHGTRCLRARGTFVKVGQHMKPFSFDETSLWWQELKIVGVNSHGMETIDGRDIPTFELAQLAIAAGEFSTKGYITHTYPLSEYKEAFRMAISNPDKCLKVAVDCTK